jgi:plasmid stabilization system protein ParE
MKVVVLPAARADLEKIGDNIALDSPRRAIAFIAELRQRCEGLRDLPERFPLIPRYEARGIRRMAHGDYLIFYTVRDEAVFIIHVLHGKMDYESLLFSAS